MYSTYLGGSGQDEVNSIAVDLQGDSYVTGTTTSPNFPIVGTSLTAAPGGTTIGFVSKLNPTGTGLVYSTYLGGTTLDAPQSIAIDASGKAYVTGMTSSADFPVTPGNALQSTYGAGAVFNAFLAKLSSDGQTLLYSTFLGGSTDDEGTSVAVDSNQNAFLTGYTSSSNFPVTSPNALQTTLNSPNGNAFVTRIDTTRTGASSLIYSTFLGGSSPYSLGQLRSGSFGGDGALGLALDGNENVYVVGEASSTDFPITINKAYQTTGSSNNSVFLSRIDTTLSGASSLVYSTFLGGTGYYGDLGSGVALDTDGNTYITGSAFSSDFPRTLGGANSSNGKAFVAKFNTNSSGWSSLIYSTLVGGSGGEQGIAVAVDPNGDAYVGGDTGSTDFPVTVGAVQSSLLSGSSWTGFLAGLSTDGSTLIYGTYFGGSGTGSGDIVRAITSDPKSNVYFAGQTDSANIPTTQGTLQTTLAGSANAFVGKLANVVTPIIANLTPPSGSVSTTVLITGTDFGETQVAGSTVTFNGVVAPVTNWSSSSISVFVPVELTPATVTVIVNTPESATNGQSFNVLPSLLSLVVQPSIPGMIVGGTQQFTATGIYSNGSTQDLTPSVSWDSYNQGVATISASGLARGLTAGTASIVASFGSVSRNVPLTVVATATPPGIMAQALPTPNANGWNDSIVMVTFICTAGSANVVSCPNARLVSTEGTNQLVTGIATDAAGGNVSTSVTLNIEKTPPTLVVSSPIDQSTETSSNLPVSGTLASSLTPISGVTCNGTSASFSSNSFTCNVSLNPGLNLLMVIAQDLAGNTAGVRLHVKDSNALPAPTSLQITPSDSHVSIGSTQQFSVVDQLGQPRTDSTWTVDNSSVATISADSSPLLTGISGGQLTLTATVGNISAQTQVTVLGNGVTLSTGSILWSSPGISGTDSLQIIPVVHTSGSNADVISLDEDGPGRYLLREFTGSGKQIWQNALSGILIGGGGVYGDYPITGFGDSSGGVILAGSQGFMDIDGATGSPAWRSDFPIETGARTTTGAVGQDGSIYSLHWSPSDSQVTLVRVDPDSGHAAPIVILPPNSYMVPIFPGIYIPGGDEWNPPMVAEDGTIYAEYADQSVFPQDGYLLQVSPNGTMSSQLLSHNFGAGGTIIPDGQGGVLVAWTVGHGGYAGDYFYRVLDTKSGATYTFRTQTPNTAWTISLNLVLGGDGTGYATDGVTIWAFNPISGSGTANWTSQLPQWVLSMFAIQPGGVFVVDGNWDALQIDSGGTTTMIGSPTIVPYIPVVSALGYWYVPVSSGQANVAGASQFVLPVTVDVTSPWPEWGGEPQAQNASVQIPTYFGPLSAVSSSEVCDLGTSGYYVNLNYQVLDESKRPIKQSGMTPQEHVNINGQDTFPGFKEFATPSTTDSLGAFHDVPVGTCFGPPMPSGNPCVDVVQTFQIVNGKKTNAITTKTTRRDCALGIKITVVPGSGTDQTTYTFGTVN